MEEALPPPPSLNLGTKVYIFYLLGNKASETTNAWPIRMHDEITARHLPSAHPHVISPPKEKAVCHNAQTAVPPATFGFGHIL